MPELEEKTQERLIGYTEVFEANKASKATVVVNVGGAGSSKSHSLAQLFVHKLINESNKTFGVCRRTFPALRMTSYDLIIGLLKQYGIYREERHNKTANTYSYKDNIIHFFSLDDSEKIKSTSFNYLWLEEANEFTFDDFIIFKTRLRSAKKLNERNQIFLSCNPSDSFGWVATKLCGIISGNNN